MIAYKVAGEFIYNVYLALYKSWKTGSKLELYCKDHEYDLYDWSIEPELSLDDLMTVHAKKLRNEYDRLVLLWSGGTDSHTIYNIFCRGQIHIDEIIVKSSHHSIGFPECNYEWIVQNHWDPTTIITRCDDHDSEIKVFDLSDENWIWRNKGDLFNYGLSVAGEGIRFLCEKNHGGKRWCAIGGYEKPRLIFRNGKWFARHLDSTLRASMGYDYIHHFFLDPIINIKQSHLVKQAVKKRIQDKKIPLWNDDWAEAKWDKDIIGYREWATACGRHDELTIGVSITQKHYIELLYQTEINTIGNWQHLKFTNDVRLENDLTNQNKIAMNFVKGFHNLYSEKDFINFLNENNWFRKNNCCMTNLKFTWGKEYDLGS